MAKRSAKSADVIDVGEKMEETEDLRLTKTDGGSIVSWLGGLPAFFLKARELETEALAVLDEAKALKAPANGDDDQKVQRFILATTAKRKAIEEHWSITSVVHKFHRRLTAKRDIGAAALESANKLANGLHNQYTEAERRRVEAENRKRQEEAEFLARQQQQQELAIAEAKAIEAESAAPELSAREAVFVDRYTAPGYMKGDGRACAQAAGFRDPVASATRLLGSAKILAAIKAKTDAIAIRTQAAARAAQPLQVDPIIEVEADIKKAPGAHDRTTWSGEILDSAATVEAFRSGKYGIPGDLFVVDPVKLNEYARSLHERLALWPGVRAKKTTGVV